MFMETNPSPPDEFVSAQLSPDAKYFLGETARWASVVSIIGFVGIAIGLLALVMSLPSMAGSAGNEETVEVFTVAVAVFFLLYVIPLVYLLKFTRQTAKGLSTQSNTMLTEAFRLLRSHYRLSSILFIGFACLLGILTLLLL